MLFRRKERPIALAALAWCAAAAPAAAAPPLQWERAPVARAAAEVRALAFDPASGRLALGDARGVLLRDADGASHPLSLRAPVRALVFGQDGALLIGSERGLYRLDADGRIEERSPSLGEAARRVRDLDAIGVVVAAATDDGVFLSRDARHWQSLGGALPAGAALAVALREQAAGPELWVAFAAELWSARLREAPDALVLTSAQRETHFTAAWEAAEEDEELQPGAVHLVLGLPGADVLLVAARELTLRSDPSARWTTLRPTLPPGASATRAGFALGRFWLATDRGLLEAPALAGPWQRSGLPAGVEPTVDAAEGAGTLWLALADGLLAARAGAEGPRPSAQRAAQDLAGLADPDLRRVHAAALAYLELGPDRVRRLRRGVARRGLLPIVDLRLTRSLARDVRRERDEAFTSGELHRLYDGLRGSSRDFGATLSFSWDLGDSAYHPEEIDVSKEAREVIELRDDVLDEITQLYFERRRLLLELAGLPAERAPEAPALRLRAEELAAGLDAWTGGWFSRQLPRRAP